MTKADIQKMRDFEDFFERENVPFYGLDVYGINPTIDVKLDFRGIIKYCENKEIEPVNMTVSENS